MAKEATVNSRIRINKGTLQWDRPASFQADVSVFSGPTPGLVLATTSGTRVDLSLLGTPGLCRIENLDSTNFVTVGIYDPETNKFYPMLDLLPGEAYPMRLSRFIEEELGTGTGSGTEGPTTNQMMVKANGADCKVSVEAWEL